MLQFLLPQMSAKEWLTTLLVCIAGSLLAGGYGILHDQVTYSISPEYFELFKYRQFQWARWTNHHRWYVATIGFLATWWVGLISSWFLARRAIIAGAPTATASSIVRAFSIMLACVVASGVVGYVWGIVKGPDADDSTWYSELRLLGISDHWAFVRVAYIHNAGYFGAAVGLFAACTLDFRSQPRRYQLAKTRRR